MSIFKIQLLWFMTKDFCCYSLKLSLFSYHHNHHTIFHIFMSHLVAEIKNYLFVYYNFFPKINILFNYGMYELLHII